MPPKIGMEEDGTYSDGVRVDQVIVPVPANSGSYFDRAAAVEIAVVVDNTETSAAAIVVDQDNRIEIRGNDNAVSDYHLMAADVVVVHCCCYCPK